MSDSIECYGVEVQRDTIRVMDQDYGDIEIVILKMDGTRTSIKMNRFEFRDFVQKLAEKYLEAELQ